MNTLYLPILLGTNRKNRESEKVAKYVEGLLKENPEIETKLFDVRDFYFPSDDQGQSTGKMNPEFKKAMNKADGLVIVSPEYNHGYPGTLKLAIDSLYDEYYHKAAGVVAVSDGQYGGARMTESLISVLKAVGLSVIKYDLNFYDVINTVTKDGKVLDKQIEKRAAGFVSELTWMAKTLRLGRRQFPKE